MRTRKGSETTLVLAAAGILVLSAATAQAADIRVGSTVIPPGGDGSVTVSLSVEETETAVGTENDIGFTADAAIPAREINGALLSASITADDTAIPVTDASDFQAFGTVTIGDEQIAYGAIGGENNNTLVAGGCTGGDAGNTPCLTTDDCSGGATCEPVGRGQGVDPASCPGATGCPAAHEAGDAVEVGLIPDCQASGDLATLMKDVVFSYIPDTCDPGVDCDTVRAIVIALDNLGTFPTGTTNLYQCNIVASENLGTYPLACENGQVSGEPDGGGLLPNVSCTSGEVTITNVCVGDCNSDGEVSLGEVQTAFNAFLNDDVTLCEAADASGDGSVSLGEVQQSFNSFLDGCPS